ncbi:MAG: biotin/lipoyl-containing protein [Caldilineales bacterium]
MNPEYTYQVGDRIKTVRIERDGEGFVVTVDGRAYDIRAERPEHGRLNLQVGDRRLRAVVARDGLRRYVAMAGETWTLERPQAQTKRRGAAADRAQKRLEAVMPGLVLDVLVQPGDAVEQGQSLVLLSAMKMELRVAAATAGVVKAVHCAAGEVVERGQVLVEME